MYSTILFEIKEVSIFQNAHSENKKNTTLPKRTLNCGGFCLRDLTNFVYMPLKILFNICSLAVI